MQDLENEGYEFEAAEASFDLLVKKAAGLYAEVRAAGVPREHRGRRPTAAPVTEATVKVRVGGQAMHTVSEGDGPVNALDGALRKALLRELPAAGGDAPGRLQGARRQRTSRDGRAGPRRHRMARRRRRVWGTVGVSENIIEASWLALVDAVEYKLFKDEEGGQPG